MVEIVGKDWYLLALFYGHIVSLLECRRSATTFHRKIVFHLTAETIQYVLSVSARFRYIRKNKFRLRKVIDSHAQTLFSELKIYVNYFQLFIFHLKVSLITFLSTMYMVLNSMGNAGCNTSTTSVKFKVFQRRLVRGGCNF